EEGIRRLQHGLAAHRTMGVEVGRPYYLALLTKTYLQAGQTVEGLKTMEEAFTSVQLNGEQYYEAELYRLKGELIRKSMKVRSAVRDKEAETYFLKAAEIARRQSAKALELRAILSLSRLWQQTGKKQQAHHMLREIYNWFTEGFETADLRTAKELLEMLS